MLEDVASSKDTPHVLPRALPRPKREGCRRLRVLYTPPPSRKIAVPTSQYPRSRKETTFPPDDLTTRALETPSTTRSASEDGDSLEDEGSALEDDYLLVVNVTPMTRQLETRPISAEQLTAEAVGIYAGISKVEAPCIKAYAKTVPAIPCLHRNQWESWYRLNQVLLHEHHDFYLAANHPSANAPLRKLAGKYSMPARMWRNGICNIQELHRHRLPGSREHMWTFIYTAYNMMALLATDNNDIRDRDIWTGIARYWYSKATDKTPHIARRFHRLASLARPNVLQLLFYYCKSLAVTAPFYPARESILTFFHTIFSPEDPTGNHNIDAGFIQIHGINFTHISFEKFDDALSDYLNRLDQNIGERKSDWKELGAYIAICNIIGLTQYGAEENLLRLALRQRKSRQVPEEDMEVAPPAAADENTVEYESLLPPLRYEWARNYFPGRWFEDAQLDEEERSVEVPSTENVRIGRILWLTTQVDTNGGCLVYTDKKFQVHPPLVARIEDHQKLEVVLAFGHEMSSDIDMTSGEDDYVHVGLSEEVRRLEQQERQLNSELKAYGKAPDSAEEPKQAVAKGPESLKESLSLLNNDHSLSRFWSLIPIHYLPIPKESGWNCAKTAKPLAPYPDTFGMGWAIITELLGLTNSTGPVGDSTKAAMVAIHEALTEERNVKIVTAKGSNMTNMDFYREQLD
ncbi:hypothetical protein L873DRAFT_1789914 [Choiromyces venosus 120613-1]|uniref:DNA/RNA-binding domain-containing protein n=1 Tax=Choiromyces venosus 120613-1 TaxID=1336337 RepID=A0A3N4JQ73_9PEZI|nr:hypothetical protein L873DRAFT_1789914 [Choiromyces venosus 120613-1]